MSETIEELDAVFAHAATDPETIAAAEAGHAALERGDVRPLSDVEMLDENRTPGDGWLRGYEMTAETLRSSPYWQSNEWPEGERPILPAGALDVGEIRKHSYRWRAMRTDTDPRTTRVSSIAKCEDCRFCQFTPEWVLTIGGATVWTERSKVVCVAEPRYMPLVQLSTRPDDCPMRGERLEWAP